MTDDILHREDNWKWPVVLTEFVLLNIFLFIVWTSMGLRGVEKALLTWSVSIVIGFLFCPPMVFMRKVRSEQVASAVLKTSVLIIFVFYALLNILKAPKMKFMYYVIFAVCVFIIIFISRMVWYRVIRRWRFSGRDNIKAVFVGSGMNMSALYEDMTNDASAGYTVVGYFDDSPSVDSMEEIEYLGRVNELFGWLEEHKVNYLFCNLPSDRSKEIYKIINYCENHLVHFYSVPNVRNYVRHRMSVQFIGNSIVLALRNEPMRTLRARILKRTFDIVFSFLVIVLLLWWVTIIVAIITMITMPGPIFFRQKRNGLDNKEFTCLKFRTMVVNKDADKVQATKDDERITKWGHFMRKTNIDELPQFINVLIGDMSVVGPRPHMIKHNVEYQQLIDSYMVRFYCRPGITGWAQVTGSRGETRVLNDMEERIRKDIWYIENWTFMLDIRIILLTVYNMFGGEKGNAY